MERLRKAIADLAEIDPFLVLSWSGSPQPELGGLNPVDWLDSQDFEDPNFTLAPLALAAERAVHSLSH